MAKKEEKIQDLQFITIGDKKVYEIKDTFVLGAHKYNVRLVEDKQDGSYLVEHSVFSDSGKRFIGNVRTVIYASDEKGKVLYHAEIDSPQGDRLIYDRNRQALSDSKNDYRSNEGRGLDPKAKAQKAIVSSLKTSTLPEETLVLLSKQLNIPLEQLKALQGVK